ncbi:MAG: hypothetical protein OCC45_08940 [Desulfotalea sp.]
MYDKEKIIKHCLRCKKFRLVDEQTGKCTQKIDGETVRCEKGIDDTCENWQDSGQQYYIRLGWLKNKKSQSGE